MPRVWWGIFVGLYNNKTEDRGVLATVRCRENLRLKSYHMQMRTKELVYICFVYFGHAPRAYVLGGPFSQIAAAAAMTSSGAGCRMCRACMVHGRPRAEVSGVLDSCRIIFDTTALVV